MFVFEESRHSLFVHDVRRDAADEDRSFRIANLRGVVRCRIGNRIFRGVLVVFFESSGARRERRLDDFRFSRRRLLLLLLALLLLPLLFLAATRMMIRPFPSSYSSLQIRDEEKKLSNFLFSCSFFFFFFFSFALLLLDQLKALVVVSPTRFRDFLKKTTRGWGESFLVKRVATIILPRRDCDRKRGRDTRIIIYFLIGLSFRLRP